MIRLQRLRSSAQLGGCALRASRQEDPKPRTACAGEGECCRSPMRCCRSPTSQASKECGADSRPRSYAYGPLLREKAQQQRADAASFRSCAVPIKAFSLLQSIDQSSKWPCLDPRFSAGSFTERAELREPLAKFLGKPIPKEPFPYLDHFSDEARRICEAPWLELLVMFVSAVVASERKGQTPVRLQLEIPRASPRVGCSSFVHEKVSGCWRPTARSQ